MKHLNHFLASMSLAMIPGVALAQSQPGAGYRIPEVKSPHAPSAPAMNENGTYPSHSRHA